jgi:hypothetical protein
MVAVFWDCKGVPLLDVMQRGTTNKTEAHTSKLKKIKEALPSHSV